jgi:hypothetical protein
MISFSRPTNLNGAELIDELEAAGVSIPRVNNEPIWPVDDMSGLIWLQIDESDKDIAKEVLAAHNGTI